MMEKTIEVEGFPGSQVTFRPLTGPYLWDLSHSNMRGAECYNAFRYAVTDWKDAPLLGERTSEKYDPGVIDMIKPGFVVSVVTQVMQIYNISEDDEKNS